jgi:hypothetical protein
MRKNMEIKRMTRRAEAKADGGMAASEGSLFPLEIRLPLAWCPDQIEFFA